MHYGQANTLTLRREEYNTAMLHKFNVNLMLYAEFLRQALAIEQQLIHRMMYC